MYNHPGIAAPDIKIHENTSARLYSCFGQKQPWTEFHVHSLLDNEKPSTTCATLCVSELLLVPILIRSLTSRRCVDELSIALSYHASFPQELRRSAIFVYLTLTAYLISNLVKFQRLVVSLLTSHLQIWAAVSFGSGFNAAKEQSACQNNTTSQPLYTPVFQQNHLFPNKRCSNYNAKN